MAHLKTVADSGEVAGETERVVHRYSGSVVCVEMTAGRWAVADTDDFRQFALEGTAGELWRSFDGHSSDPEIIAQVLSSYPGHPESAATECLALIGDLVRLRLLETVGPGPGDEQADNGRRELRDDVAD